MTIFDVILTMSDISFVGLKPVRIRLHESTFYTLTDEVYSHGRQIWDPDPETPTMYGIDIEIGPDDEPEGILVGIPETPREESVDHALEDVLVVTE